MSTSQDVSKEMEKLRSEMRAAVREHWKAFLIEGILLVILGLAAMIVPPLASLAVTIFLGWMFLISGIAGLALTRSLRSYWRRRGGFPARPESAGTGLAKSATSAPCAPAGRARSSTGSARQLH